MSGLIKDLAPLSVLGIHPNTVFGIDGPTPGTFAGPTILPGEVQGHEDLDSDEEDDPSCAPFQSILDKIDYGLCEDDGETLANHTVPPPGPVPEDFSHLRPDLRPAPTLPRRSTLNEFLLASLFPLDTEALSFPESNDRLKILDDFWLAGRRGLVAEKTYHECLASSDTS
jgi:hypothetical protein